ncbi:hypothetical protein SAMCFNEI73_Ch2295 [Sinorhizobium americanum]|uniref:Uncharacterized protein n=1 Tax=Sinorhizobium americanum TaxID=194963 RepID=A0A1L3LNB6_9HYPH|nr:hypothetical protein SAMCCGM7_Ch2187 [Sinorhizobium americanum CCGM7]APG91577.1 hypothetical protein SAMCFNEI73_Ch2295 [Sinorhizobium americanum]
MVPKGEEFFAKILQRVLDKPGQRHYTPHQIAATRSWTGD